MFTLAEREPGWQALGLSPDRHRWGPRCQKYQKRLEKSLESLLTSPSLVVYRNQTSRVVKGSLGILAFPTRMDQTQMM